MGKNRVKLLQKNRPDLHRTAKGFFMRVHRPSRGWWLVQADKEPRLHLEKGAAAAALHRADGYIRAGASRGRTPAMISSQEGATQAFFKNRAALCGPRPPAPLKILPHWTPSKHRAAHPSAWAGVRFPWSCGQQPSVFCLFYFQINLLLFCLRIIRKLSISSRQTRNGAVQ